MKKKMLMSALLGAICTVTAVAGEGKIVVQKAAYGVVTDPDLTRDVTAEVQALATNATLVLPVAEIAKLGDPAPNIVKTLRVEYTINGESLIASAPEGRLVFLGKPKVAIKKAIYGQLDDPAKTCDVTQEVESLLAGESMSVPVSAMSKWVSPVFGVVKTLQVEYVVGRKTVTVSGVEGETLDFSSAAAK